MLNAITAEYSGWREPREIAEMYNHLAQCGVEIPLFSDYGGSRHSHPFTFCGEEVENSSFVYIVYTGARNTARNEYTIYFS
jgi:hypothetical protein